MTNLCLGPVPPTAKRWAVMTFAGGGYGPC